MRRRTAGLLALSLALIAPSSAHAVPQKCAKTATVESGEVLGFTSFDSEGEPLSGDTIRRGAVFYRAQSKVQIAYAGNTYTVQKGSTFMPGCYGRSVQTGLTLPLLDLLNGEIKVKTAARKPGGVVTAEGLIDPRQDPTVTFSVSRELRSGDDPTPEQLRAWFGNLISAAKGTTRAETGGKPTIGVTPYVGPRRGSCRYVHGAKLTSKGTSGGYFTGTASYTP